MNFMSILHELKVNRSVVKFVPIRSDPIRLDLERIIVYIKKYVTTDCLL